MNWVDEFVQSQKNRNITTDLNKQHMINLIPLLDKMLAIVNPKLGKIIMNGWEVDGIKKIVITFLEGQEEI